MSGTLYGFPGGDTGKRWHILAEVTGDKEEWSSPYFVGKGDYASLCKTWGARLETVTRNVSPDYVKTYYDDIFMFSDRQPFPMCAHCTRLKNKI